MEQVLSVKVATAKRPPLEGAGVGAGAEVVEDGCVEEGEGVGGEGVGGGGVGDGAKVGHGLVTPLQV